MSEIKALNYKKGALKSILTLCNKFLDQVELKLNSTTEVEKTTFYEIESRYLKLQTSLDEYKAIHMEIFTIKINNQEENFDDLTECEDFEKSYYNVISRCKILMDTLKESEVKNEELDN